VDPGGPVVTGFGDAVVYLNDPYNWTRPGGILDLIAEHMVISGLAVLGALLIALPAGIFLGTTNRGGGAVVVVSNVSRAIPTLALLTLFAVSPIGFGNKATTIALAVFAIPPILTNTYVGFRGVDADVREAARAMGMSRGAVIGRVDLPLALPLVMTGVRTAAVQVVATAGLAALVGGGGLGRLVNLGFGQQDYGLIIAGAILFALLAMLTEAALVLLTWAVTPGPRRLPWSAHRKAAVPAGVPEPTASGVPL
jgi:osmoprotectant transport system permease protein